MRHFFRSLVAILATSFVASACGGGSSGTRSTYSVAYDGNGATGGTVPVDSGSYAQGQTVTVLGNTGTLTYAGHSFAGWNTQPNGSGASYTQGQTCPMGTANITLYAQWTTNAAGDNVTYDGNGATGGSAPSDPLHHAQGQPVTVLGNTGNLVYSGYSFVGWQTKADGSGTTYAPGRTFLMGAANVTLYALWAGGHAYVANQNGGSAGSVSQYTIGPNGALTPMFAPTVATAGNNSQQVAVDPTGKHAYVSNVSSNTVSQFTIGEDGALAPMSTPTISMGPGPGIYYPLSIAVHPSGKWAYIAINQRSSVNQYTIGSDGSLSPMTPASVPAGTYPTTVTVDPSGKYAYLSNGRDNTVSQYTIDQATGALSPMTPPTVAAAGTSGKENAWFFEVEPKGKYAYVTNYFDGTISQYNINQTNGTLSAMTPATVATGGTYAGSIAVDPSGKYAYVTILGATAATAVAQFDIDQTNGTLSPMTPPTVSAGGAAAAFITVEASGKYAYATSGDTGWGSATVAQYAIGADGALTLMSNPTVPSGYGPTGIITVGK